jgi:outer membrane protein assembly factor BamB
MGGNTSAGTAGTSTTGGSGAAGSAGTAGAGTAGAGTAGAGGNTSAGAGGAGAGAGSVAGGTTATNESVTQRGADNARTSHWLAPTLTKANLAKMAIDTNFKANFDGEFTGVPLFLAGATPGTGRFFAATTENDVYALDELTGAQVWKHNIGGYLVTAPVCGNDPINHGIVSTPIIDAAAHKIFLAAAMTDGHHEIHALSTDTGMEVAGWPVDVSQIKAGSRAFPSKVQNQRSALSLVNGILYVAFGGYCGDAGNYQGWVIGVNSADPSKTGAWVTKDARQAGIWAAGGLASDGIGVFAVTGNAPEQSNHDNTDSEEILRITDLGVGHRDSVNMFYPTEWANPMNSSDKDFGSASPSVVTVPGAKPATIIVAPAKPGRVYFLDSANLGGSLGQFADMVVADTDQQSIYTTPSAYTTTSGVHIAITAGSGGRCPNGTTSNVVMSLLLKPSAADQPPMPAKAWCATIAGGDVPKRSPISTNSSGASDPIVWFLNGSNLNGYDGETGAVLYDSSKVANSACAGAHKFTTLIAANGRIVAGGDSGGKAHLCSWSVH